MPQIEISTETYAGLQALARPFEDTPDTVIRRLLAERGNATQAPPHHERPSGRAVVGQIIPEKEYWVPILQALDERGGEAAAVDVIARVGELLSNRFTETDHGDLQGGEVRWKKRTQFARLKMVHRGLLDDESPRGIWRITPKGRSHLDRELQPRIDGV